VNNADLLGVVRLELLPSGRSLPRSLEHFLDLIDPHYKVASNYDIRSRRSKRRNSDSQTRETGSSGRRPTILCS
jgi:Golgi nucleoside diphosphatase